MRGGYGLVGVEMAVSWTHYLRSAVSARLSPLGGEREGRSYLRKDDNPPRTCSDPCCPARWTDRTFTPPHTPPHLAFPFSVGAPEMKVCLRLYNFF